MNLDEIYPPDLRQAEARLLNRRGSQSCCAVGLAISGGGIRSATFALGILQSLARVRLLRRIDYMSTVSGGGYTGSFLGALFVRSEAAGISPGGEVKSRCAEVEDVLATPGSWPLHWLRESGRYMSPTGAGDTLIALTAYLRNWIAIQVVVGSLALTVLLWATLASVSGACWLGDTQWLPWSPVVALPLLVLAFWSIPAGTAFWLNWPLAAALAILAILAFAAGYGLSLAGDRVVLGAILTIALLSLAVGAWYSWKYPPPARRRYLTEGLKVSLLAASALAGIAIADGLGFRLYKFVAVHEFEWHTLLGATGLAIPFSVAQHLAARLTVGTQGKKPVRVPMAIIAGLAASVVVVAASTGLSAVAWAVAFHGAKPAAVVVPGCTVTLTADRLVRVDAAAATRWQPAVCAQGHKRTLALAGLGGAAFCLLIGRSRGFLNLSTHQPLYSARLIRAYLGASNPTRKSLKKALTDPIPGDDIPLTEYRPHERGGPLHLINVTVNETLSGETQVEQRDRKGMNLAVGPCGLSVGARHHAIWARRGDSPGQPEPPEGPLDMLRPVAPEAGYRVFERSALPPEPLTLGQWLSISGAAFSTGLGSRTSLGVSLLLGLANIRLGYWWNSGIDPVERSKGTGLTGVQSFWRWLAWLAPVHSYLVGELLALFHGPARQWWYLSDGGHFENSALYELVRRRVPFMICCDSGQDPDYQWSDVGDLVRKARIDFNAEVRFLDAAELKGRSPGAVERWLVPWSEFTRYEGQSGPARNPAAASGSRRGCAAMAEVTYVGASETSTILFIKPNLCGDEPADLLTYWARNREFPQQTTADQYFDEAQWESYRRLGELAGERLFPASDTWAAHGFKPRLEQ